MNLSDYKITDDAITITKKELEERSLLCKDLMRAKPKPYQNRIGKDRPL